MKAVEPISSLRRLLPVAAALAFSGVSWSQQGAAAPPGAENAHAFLNEVLGRNNEVSAFCEHKFSDCADTFWITFFQGSACQTEVQFRMTDGRLDSFTIDWSKVAGIKLTNNDALIVQGGTRAHWNWVYFRTGSEEMAMRVARAMTVIRTACDKAAKYGF